MTIYRFSLPEECFQAKDNARPVKISLVPETQISLPAVSIAASVVNGQPGYSRDTDVRKFIEKFWKFCVGRPEVISAVSDGAALVPVRTNWFRTDNESQRNIRTICSDEKGNAKFEEKTFTDANAIDNTIALLPLSRMSVLLCMHTSSHGSQVLKCLYLSV